MIYRHPHRILGSLLAVSLIGVIVAVHGSFVFAQTPNSPTAGQALEIAPPVINLKANPGETIKAQINLRDISSSKLVVRNEINDFVANGEDGSPKVLLDQSEPNPYSIKSWISPLPELTLKPKQIENLSVNITVPKNAAPGGYFGVIRFTATAPELKDTGVSLSASLGSLILLRVNGDAKENMEIAEFFTADSGTRSWLFESAPVNFITRLKNTGTTHEQPTGRIAITDMFGKDIAGVNVNLGARNVLPGSIRRFEEPLDESVIGNKMLFGRYTAKLHVTYGANKQTIDQELSFWVIPYKLIIGIIVGIIALVLIIRFALKRYTDAVLSRSRRSRRR